MALADTARLIASLELEDKFSKNINKFDSALGRTEQRMSTLERVGFQAGRGLRNAADNLKTIGVIGGGLAVAGIIKSVNAASDLQESLSKTEVVFGDLSDEIVAWSQTSVDAFGLSQQAALETAGTFGNLFSAMGAAPEASAEMSQGLVELAADLASFNNLDTPEVLEKLRAGIVGEAEPLRTLGIQISAVRTEAKALELGFKKVDGQLSPLAKATANYQIILEDSQKAQGDFARTSDGLANQQRILKARLDNTAATLGQSLTPVLAKMAGRLDELLVEHQDDIKAFGDALPAAFDQLVEIGENIPWETIGSSLQLAGRGAQILLGAFTSMPDWVQTAVLTGWGLNKLTGGALFDIGKTIFGALRGSTPATPLFTKEVGPGGIGGGAGGPGGLLTGGNLLKLGLGIGGGILVHELVKQLLRGENAFTPSGPKIGRPDLVPPKTGVSGSAVPKAFFDNLGQQIRVAEKATTQAVRDGDIHAARLADRQANLLHDLQGTINKNTNGIIPHLGRVHRGLSTANRNFEEGNRRQRDTYNAIREARDRIGSGFQRTNDQLGVIAAKDFSPNVNVAFTANTSVSISEVTRAAVSNSFASGFTPRLL